MPDDKRQEEEEIREPQQNDQEIDEERDEPEIREPMRNEEGENDNVLDRDEDELDDEDLDEAEDQEQTQPM